jgi:hypothetical protein
MRIDNPSFSGSITQAPSAYAALSGSFTGSFTGSFRGEIEVDTAQFTNLTVVRELTLGSFSDDEQNITGSILMSGSMELNGNINVINGGQLQVEGVNVLDSAIAFAIALG